MWAYDADGNRTSFTDTRGTTTTYTRDSAGRLTTVTNPLLGHAVFTHNPSGRLTSATAGYLVQEWAYRHGALAEHSRTVSSTHAGWADHMDGPESASSTTDGTDVTLIGRDDDSRITALTRAGAVTRYGYDGAGQLITATTSAIGGSEAPAPAPQAESTSEWEYDAGGRLVREATPAGSRVFDYDAAGQLLAIIGPDGSRTEFIHDGLGRRTRLIHPGGSWTEYAWGPTGHLKSTCDRTPDGEVTSRHELWVDALGELAGIDGARLWWDTANHIPTLTGITPTTSGGTGPTPTSGLAGVAGEQVLSLPGGVTGIGEAWTASGWRAARPTDEADPWAVLGAPAIPDPSPGRTSAGMVGGLPVGVSLTRHGGVDTAGLEWLGGGALTAGRAAAAMASLASRLGSYVAVNAGVNGAAGAVGGAATHLIKNGGRVDNWRSFAGSVAGGTLSGAVGGLAGPAGGTLARAGGHGAYTLTAAGARPTLQAAAATTALGSGGAIAGTVTDKFISGEAVTWADVGWSGITGGALTHLPGGPSSSSTLQQAARTNVSTLSGLASGGPNSIALVRSSLYGTTTGSGLDVAKFFVAGN